MILLFILSLKYYFKKDAHWVIGKVQKVDALFPNWFENLIDLLEEDRFF